MNIRRVVLATIAVLFGVLGWAVESGASTPRRGPRVDRTRPPQRIQSYETKRRIDGNQINMWVTNYGSFAWDVAGQGQPPGFIYPKGTAKTAVYASGLWLGAQVNGETRAVVAEYDQEYGPGPIIGGTYDDPGLLQHRVYKMIRFESAQDSTHLDRTAAELAADPLLDPVAHHSWSEYLAGAKPYGAPTRIYRLPRTDTPDPADSTNVEGPDVVGDQMLWCVYNDADPQAHSNGAGSSTPFKVEIRQTTFAFNRQGALGNTVFLEFKILYKGDPGDTLKNMFVSLWSDPDLGGFTDDLVGCDTTLSLGFVYNATNSDQLYGKRPPAVGYDFFLGPVDRATGDTLGLNSFNKYINGTDPATAQETYNYMSGLLPDGGTLVDPITGQATRFFHPGNPVLGTGWLDSNPADRRFLMSSGPFTMVPGDTQTVVAAIIVGQGKNRLSSVAGLKFFDQFAQDAFDLDFDIPSPPPQPKVNLTTDHGVVTLSWDTDSRLQYQEPGYSFEGYNVYQGETVAGPWTLIATYDEDNATRVIYDEIFDLETGQVIPSFPVAFGSDAGVRFSHTQAEDEIRGGLLKDGTEYYFAVTAYSHNPNYPRQKVLENAQNVIRVIPQRPAAGTDLSTVQIDCPVYSQVAPAASATTDRVIVEVVNPDSVTGHDYRVSYADLPAPVILGPDTVRVGWNLVDVTTTDTLLRNQVNKSGDDDYAVLTHDGIRIRVVGPHRPKAGLAEGDFLCRPNDFLGPTPNLAGLAVPTVFGTGGVEAYQFFGGTMDPASSPSDSFETVEIRFSSTQTQKAYRYLRAEVAELGDPPPQGRGWTYGGFHEVPFTVWNTENNQQLEAMFVERLLTDVNGTVLPGAEQEATFDSTWLPSSADNGGREILVVVDLPYTGSARPELAADEAIVAETQPLEYLLWARRTSNLARIPEGAAFRFLWNAVPGAANDLFTIGTDALVRANTGLAASRLDRIRVVPNPYYNRSRYELNQFSRRIRFMNLPEVCTIRIFNLGGDLIRTLRKTDPGTSILTWDAQTDSALPVASGIYVYHVEMPDGSSSVGRLIVFMEKERLNNF